jgi:hypothetical protein
MGFGPEATGPGQRIKPYERPHQEGSDFTADAKGRSTQFDEIRETTPSGMRLAIVPADT